MTSMALMTLVKMLRLWVWHWKRSVCMMKLPLTISDMVWQKTLAAFHIGEMCCRPEVHDKKHSMITMIL
jgi:hypothetical protein